MSDEKTPVATEPTAKPPMGTRIANKARQTLTKVTTREGWVGDYDFVWLCAPTLPYGKNKARKLPPFYGLEDDIPFLLAIICGFQHALAMLAGLITPPIIFSSALSLDAATSSYLISSSLIGCGM
jgi:uric acid-xanthine permease